MTEQHPSIDLSVFLTKLPSEPGIYRMLDANEVVLYVGKASHLKKRVNSYFNQPSASPKTRALVAQIARIEITITRSETEALLLESSLIKSLRPKYNVLMRDDKSYPYLALFNTHPTPRLTVIRSKKKPTNGLFFGPYPSVAAVRETLNVIQKAFKIRNCSDSFFNARSRPCLQYQIKRCSAPCTKAISIEDYQRSVVHAVAFLEGKSDQILSELARQMEHAVAHLAFEEAAICRDQIKSLRLIQEQQGVSQMAGFLDVIAIDAQPGLLCVQCVMVRDGQVLDSQSFFPSIPKHDLFDTDESRWEAVFSTFIAYYYVDHPERIPSLIMTDQIHPDQAIIEAMLTTLRGKSCRLQTRPRGIKARWMDFARNNLQQAVSTRVASADLLKTRYADLQAVMKYNTPIQSLICFDISHTQGAATVASCVAFNVNGPNKRDYRQYTLSGITPGDDYAAMEQVITRHIKRLIERQSLPDVMVIDGGKGQVAVAKKVLAELGVTHTAIIGIAKGPGRKAGHERLILATEGHERTLPEDAPALHLLQHIRDESHRFAITAHRKKRQKTSFESSLETIEGIGAKRRHALLQRFGGYRELARAPLEELAKTSGISLALAQRIYAHFH